MGRSHSGHHIYLQSKYFGRKKKKKSFDFFRSGFLYFFLIFFPIILLTTSLQLNTQRALFFTNLCSSFVCPLSLSSFYATECKTKDYVQILATPGRERAAAKDPAEHQQKRRKKKKREKPSRMKHKKTPPFPLLGHKFHFFL